MNADFNEPAATSRERFFPVREEMKHGEELSAEEKIIADIMMRHKEFHEFLNNPDEMMHYRFDPGTETNPFSYHFGTGGQETD